MANPNRYFEVTLVRGIVSISTVMRFTGMTDREQPALCDVFARLPPEWTVEDGDVIKFKEVR
jgi:hypothetical protein